MIVARLIRILDRAHRRRTRTVDPDRVAEILHQHETMRALARREMGLDR